MKVSVYNQAGTAVGDIDLSDKLFAVKPDEHVLAEAVRVQQANQRLGLSHTKTRGDVRGGGKKPWKQKGTGNARAGSTRSPIWRHGGVTFGPRSNRNWSLKLNKKTRVKALAMALSDKVTEGKLIVLDTIVLPENKTRQMLGVLTGLAGALPKFGKTQLLLASASGKGVARATRNLPACDVAFATTLNLVQVLKADTMLVLKDSLPVLEKTFLSK